MFQQITVECNHHLLHSVFYFPFCQAARPYHNHLPPCLHQKIVVPLVTFAVAVNFRLPESRVGLRHHKLTASFMPMPEATVDKDSRPVFAHHDIRLSRHTPDVEPVPVSMCPQPFPDQQFRLRRLATDMRHTAVTLCRCKDIGHINREEQNPYFQKLYPKKYNPSIGGCLSF